MQKSEVRWQKLDGRKQKRAEAGARSAAFLSAGSLGATPDWKQRAPWRNQGFRRPSKVLNPACSK
jgi:hypothetical protein